MSHSDTTAGPAEILLVTGGSRGIGKAIVRAAAAANYKVAFSYLENDGAAEDLVQELSAAARVLAIKGDVSDPDFASRFMDEVAQEIGPATALVNNAGITGPIGLFENASVSTLKRVLDINLLGTMLVTQEAVRRWKAEGVSGRIVNISSIAATLGAPGEYVHYAAAKAAVDAFTIGLAKEVAAQGIRINAVAPGTTYTDIHASAGEPGRPERVVSRVPMARIAQPQEIANAVLWLLSDQASYMTGSVVRVSGGL